jgi:hypothetical protein
VLGLAGDSDLSKIVGAWPELPEHIKAAIKALVRVDKQID